jgi:hypothetical protein
MPTSQPRYTVTDTADMRKMLDLAHRRWPEIEDRRQLLLRLAATGAQQLVAEFDAEASRDRRTRQQQALARAGRLIDAEALLSDSAWR